MAISPSWILSRLDLVNKGTWLLFRVYRIGFNNSGHPESGAIPQPGAKASAAPGSDVLPAGRPESVAIKLWDKRRTTQ